MSRSDDLPVWLKGLPGDWQTAPLKSFVEGAKNGLWGDPPEDSEHTVYCARVADFNRKKAVLNLTEPTVRGVPPRKLPGRLLQPGDLLLEKSGGGEKQPVGFVVLVESIPGPTICSNFVARMPVKDDVDSRFVRYLHQHFYSRRLNTRSVKQSTGIQNLDAQSYLSELAPRPPLSTQRAIADFLDRETAKIDTLIEKKQRLLELLDEKRTALITRAVTRGLDPDVPMKDSGVEWIGEIPEQWEVVPVGRLAKGFRAGKTPPTSEPAYYRDGSVPWFGPSSLGADLWIDEPGKLIHRSAVKEGVAPLMPANTVLIQTIAEVGRVGVLTSEGSFNQQLTALTPRPQHLVSRFLAYFIYAFRDVLASWASTTTLPIISGGDLREFPIAVPPVDEQESIVGALAAFDRDRSRIVSRTAQAISLLHEYRAALISAVVTGKVGVVRGDEEAP